MGKPLGGTIEALTCSRLWSKRCCSVRNIASAVNGPSSWVRSKYSFSSIAEMTHTSINGNEAITIRSVDDNNTSHQLSYTQLVATGAHQ